MPDLSDRFPRYTEFDPRIPVWCVTPELAGCLHRFFDTSPISPSGRYLGVTRFRAEDRLPAPDETAEVVLVDLSRGETRVVAETKGFDTQLGAQVQWGATDRELYFNDMDTDAWRPYAVRLDPVSDERRDLEGPVYMVSPDGRYAASPCLLRTGLTQYGYGVQAPLERIPVNPEVAADDGIYLTDTGTGVCRLLVSIRAIADALGERLRPPELRDGAFYCSHVKWNPQGTRLMLVLRYRYSDPQRRMRAQLVTVSADGSEVHLALTAAEWAKGGHHPNWCPDGEHILMNLKLDVAHMGAHMRFVRFRYDGTGLRSLTDAVPGSGHPTLHPDGRHILTDEYVGGALAFEDGTVPIRWIDLEAGSEETVVRIGAEPDYAGPRRIFRVDQHPAWDRTYRHVAFNGCPDGTRRVYVADMSSLLV